MSVTAAANVLVLAATIAVSMDSITVISLQTSAGEIFRKIPTETEVINPQKKQFTFWLSEAEGNLSLIHI